MTLLQAKRQEKSFLRLDLRLKNIKQGNNDFFLESIQQEKWLLVLVVKLENYGTADISKGYDLTNKL